MTFTPYQQRLGSIESSLTYRRRRLKRKVRVLREQQRIARDIYTRFAERASPAQAEDARIAAELCDLAIEEIERRMAAGFVTSGPRLRRIENHMRVYEPARWFKI